MGLGLIASDCWFSAPFGEYGGECEALLSIHCDLRQSGPGEARSFGLLASVEFRHAKSGILNESWPKNLADLLLDGVSYRPSMRLRAEKQFTDAVTSAMGFWHARTRRQQRSLAARWVLVPVARSTYRAAKYRSSSLGNGTQCREIMAVVGTLCVALLV
jgi:hypothetical protein